MRTQASKLSPSHPFPSFLVLFNHGDPMFLDWFRIHQATEDRDWFKNGHVGPMVRNLPANAGAQFPSVAQEDPHIRRA